MKEKFRSVLKLATIFVVLCMGASFANAKVINGISVGSNRDFIGGDYAQFTVSSYEECLQICAQDQQCKVFAFAKSVNACALKNIVGKRVKSRGMISGHKL